MMANKIATYASISADLLGRHDDGVAAVAERSRLAARRRAIDRINDRRSRRRGAPLTAESQTVTAGDDGQGQQHRRGTLSISLPELISYALIVMAIVIGTLVGMIIAAFLWAR